MKVTKRQLRRIIREEVEKIVQEQTPDEAAAEDGAASFSDLKNWFMEKRATVRELGVPPNQIRALIDYMNDGIEAAKAGKLKAKSGYLSGIVDKISGAAASSDQQG